MTTSTASDAERIPIAARALALRAEPADNGNESFSKRRRADADGVALALARSADSPDLVALVLAHELRSPLSVISLVSQVLGKLSADDARLLLLSQRLERQVHHMAALIDHLMDDTRLRQGGLTLDCAPLDLREVLALAVEQSQPQLAQRQHTLSVQAPEAGELQVFGDRLRLVQVLVNLLANAAKYTPAGGVIAVDCRIVGRDVVTSVSDNGLGISADFIPHVFDRFRQATPSPGSSVSGVGLGLFLVRSIVELHGGEVSATSAGRGLGSQFRFWLPVLGPRALA